MTIRVRCLAGILLNMAIAMVVACTQQGGGSLSAASGVQQDISATRNIGPTSANPGVPRTGSPYLLLPRSETEGGEEVPPAPLPTTSPTVQPEIGLGGIAQGEAEAGDARTGRRFALDNCRPCHIVAPNQSSEIRFADAPGFHAIANAANTSPLGLSVWLTNPHPTMPTLVLSPQEARNVIAYIISLRDAH